MEHSVDVCVDVLGAGAGSAGSEVLLAVALSGTVCCTSAPGDASSITLTPPLLPPRRKTSFSLEIRQPGPSRCRQGKEK